jgi:hypothetical protein
MNCIEVLRDLAWAAAAAAAAAAVAHGWLFKCIEKKPNYQLELQATQQTKKPRMLSRFYKEHHRIL